MKAQKLKQEDHDLTFPMEKRVHSSFVMDHLQPGKPKASLKDQLSQSDVEVVRRSLGQLKLRNERIEALKSQINAGTYQMNSTDVAQKMVSSSLTRKALDTGRYNMFVPNDGE